MTSFGGIFKTQWQNNFILLLPLLGLALSFSPFLEASSFSVLYFFIAVVICDNGHIFLTNLRLFTKQRPRKDKLKFAFITILSVAIAALWMYFKVPYLWSFFIYFTAFHHLKQNVGILKWFQKSEGADKFEIFLCYFVFAAPLLILHLRTDIHPDLIVSGILPFQMFSAETVSLLRSLVIILILGGLLSLFWRQKNHRQPRYALRYLTSVALLNGITLMFGQNFYQIYLPLVLCHGLSYFLLISHAIGKSQDRPQKTVIPLVLTVAILYGIMDWYLQDEQLTHYQSIETSLPVLLGVALTVGLNMAHYYIDGLIWKRGDSEYQKVMS